MRLYPSCRPGTASTLASTLALALLCATIAPAAATRSHLEPGASSAAPAAGAKQPDDWVDLASSSEPWVGLDHHGEEEAQYSLLGPEGHSGPEHGDIHDQDTRKKSVVEDENTRLNTKPNKGMAGMKLNINQHTAPLMRTKGSQPASPRTPRPLTAHERRQQQRSFYKLKHDNGLIDKAVRKDLVSHAIALLPVNALPTSLYPRTKSNSEFQLQSQSHTKSHSKPQAKSQAKHHAQTKTQSPGQAQSQGQAKDLDSETLGKFLGQLLKNVPVLQPRTVGAALNLLDTLPDKDDSVLPGNDRVALKEKLQTRVREERISL